MGHDRLATAARWTRALATATHSASPQKTKNASMNDTSPPSPSAASRWLDGFFQSYYRHRPVNASFIGVHEHDHVLPDFSDSGVADALSDIDDLLASAPQTTDPPPPGTAREPGAVAEALDVRLACGFLRTQDWEFSTGYQHRGNPSLYTGQGVFSVMSLFLGHGGSDQHRLEAAAARMEAIPSLLRQGRRQVRDAPPEWTGRAIRECRGALAFLRDGVDYLDDEIPGAAEELRFAADSAARAYSEHMSWLETDLLHSPCSDWAAGEKALRLHLTDAHFLAESADDMVAYAESEMEAGRSWLAEHARDFDAAEPADALAGLAELHPNIEDYLPSYQRRWDEVRGLADREGLVTWPTSPIRYKPRPRWARAAAPHLYFLFYRSPAAFNRPPVHDYLVTPIDETVSQEEQEELLRAHNDAVIKLNHVVHHGGIGHHVQNWHAFRAASRIGRMAAVDCSARIAMSSGGTMAEGWACYATDLVDEFGGLTPLESYAEKSGRVRMCARAIVDLQLHRRRMDIDGATEFYRKNTGMPESSARSEAVKNSMFPGGAVMYLMGTDGIHALRRDVSAALGSDFDLRAFHDTFLSYGSVPVSLIAEDMKRELQTHAH